MFASQLDTCLHFKVSFGPQSTRCLGPRRAVRAGGRMAQQINCTMATDRPVAVQRPDKNGRFGKFGGKYVPETLIPALLELEEAYAEAKADPAYQVGEHRGARAGSGGADDAEMSPGHAALSAARSLRARLQGLLHVAERALLGVQAELDSLLKNYVGRETPLYFAERLSDYYAK